MTVSRCGRKWGSQDGGGCGHVIEDAHDREDGWVRVQWLADGGTNRYRWGAEACYDILVVDSATHGRSASVLMAIGTGRQSSVQRGLSLAFGCRKCMHHR